MIIVLLEKSKFHVNQNCIQKKHTIVSKYQIILMIYEYVLPLNKL